MNRIAQALRDFQRHMRSLDYDWALVGGLAVAVRSEPRTTRDVDVAVSVDGDTEAEQLARDLMGKGYLTHAALEQTDAERLATMRLMSPKEDVATIVDLLFASSGIEREIVAEATREPVLPGLILPVARLGHLLALKALAGRPLDLADFGNLLLRANDDEVDRARFAIDLIRERGFDRGIDLGQRFEELLAGTDLS